jgi:AMMECR1 domain-containing protein
MNHQILLRLAREAIETSFCGDDVVVPPDPWLRVPSAVFVTLRELPGGDLRGCVGSIEARVPLGDAVVHAARAAAFRDAQLERTRPGVLFTSGWHRSVLLPKVWESVDDAAEFLRHLKLKAGLSPSFWSASVQLDVFTCEEFAEPRDHPARVEAS